ncbi:MAG: helix-hairpin-helix domain-containing protein [Chlorobiaceae bacterium]
MNFHEKLAIKLGITKAEISMVSILLGFLMLGIITKNINSVEEADLLIKKAEHNRYRNADVDSLIRLATVEEAKVKDDVRQEIAAEEKNETIEKKPKHVSPEKKVFAGTISFNKASSLQLQKIPGIGPVMAGRLITFRTAKGGTVKQFEDFLEVKGISNKKLEVLKQYFTLE